MSLDMYLHRKVYIGANYNKGLIEGTVDIVRLGEKLKINFDKIVYIIEIVGTWFGADEIHSWFVDNVQDGVDNCADYYVAGYQLKELYELCKDVLEQHDAEYASENLPMDGDFSGKANYGEYYWESLEDTIKIIEDIMVDDPELKGDYSYSSSW